ncbi:MAG: hypothetical protein KIT43_07975 [Bauldia sp.]|nr:hypothetical protein [Bauldia sp.]MCW5719097.1 hypothetical protein [Bauldia sp.]
MKHRAFVPAVVAGCIAAAGCTPVPAPPMAAQLDHIVMVLDFDCTGGGAVSARITGTRIELSTSSGSKVYTGAHPTYFGHEASISFDRGYSTLVLAAAGEQQTCTLTGTG